MNKLSILLGLMLAYSIVLSFWLEPFGNIKYIIAYTPWLLVLIFFIIDIYLKNEVD